MIGTGYVGLVTGTCFADTGNLVTCLDQDADKIRSLQDGRIPIYEPGLAELVRRNADSGRLRFTTDVSLAVRSADIVYLAIGTPQGEDGSADLSSLWKVIEQISPHLRPEAVVVTKSTVPVGTNAQIVARLRELTGANATWPAIPSSSRKGRLWPISASRTAWSSACGGLKLPRCCGGCSHHFCAPIVPFWSCHPKAPS